jgi:hypothetical protein
VKGGSGADISHDPNFKCVYNPECLKKSLEGCFEDTGCQYIYMPGSPLCSALSPTDPWQPCPDVKGSSGADISHDPDIKCVYNPECLKESLEGCFEDTGCQYIYMSGSPLCSALSPTDPWQPCPDVRGRWADISHDPNINCVYNPECLKQPLEGCFEDTGCQYIYMSVSPLCSALSPTDPQPCPAGVKGSSGADISHEFKCLYNPECLKEWLEGCFEDTGCQYIYPSGSASALLQQDPLPAAAYAAR